MLWIVVLLEGPPTSHPQHPGGWQQVHLKNLSVHGSIHCSFNDMKSASTTRGETAPHHDTSTSKLHCWYSVIRVMCSAISPPNMVCCVTAKKFNFGLI